MKNKFEHPKGGSESPERIELSEIFEQTGQRFLELTNLSREIYIDERGTLQIAGVELQRDSLNPEILDKIKNLRKKVDEVLNKTARKAFKITRILSLSALGAAGYAAVDLNRQEGLSFKETAKYEMQENGITSDQRYSAYKPGISEMLYRAVEPLGYQTSVNQSFPGSRFFNWLDNRGIPNVGMLQKFLPNLIYGREFRAQKLNEVGKKFLTKSSEIDRGKMTEDEQAEAYDRLMTELDKELAPYALNLFQDSIASQLSIPERDDAWRLYLGLPQLSGTFGISDYPRLGTEDKYYFKLNKYWDELIRDFGSLKAAVEILNSRTGGIATAGSDPELRGLANSKLPGVTRRVMGAYTLGLGQDQKGHFIFYYDKWDLASFWAENPISKGVGKPMEIYDRLYYDPKTFEIIR